MTVRSAIFNRLRKKIALIEETENILLLAFVLTSHFPFLLQLYLVVDYMGGVPDAAWTIARQTTFCSPIVFLSDATLKSAKTTRVMEQTFTRKLKNGGLGHGIAFVVLVQKSACSSCLVSLAAVFRTVSVKTGLEKATPGPHRFNPLGLAKKNAVRHTDKTVAS